MVLKRKVSIEKKKKKKKERPTEVIEEENT